MLWHQREEACINRPHPFAKRRERMGHPPALSYMTCHTPSRCAAARLYGCWLGGGFLVRTVTPLSWAIASTEPSDETRGRRFSSHPLTLSPSPCMGKVASSLRLVLRSNTSSSGEDAGKAPSRASRRAGTYQLTDAAIRPLADTARSPCGA